MYAKAGNLFIYIRELHAQRDQYDRAAQHALRARSETRPEGYLVVCMQARRIQQALLSAPQVPIRSDMDTLPKEVLEHIFITLSARDLLHAAGEYVHKCLGPRTRVTRWI